MSSEILVYGGCVSRDLFSVMCPNDKPKNYLARQSLISAATLPVDVPTINLTSSFQKRMVVSDFRSSLFSMFFDSPYCTDLVLMDLLGERLGVLELEGGRYLTHSNELVRSGAKEMLGEYRLIKFGSEEHLSIWKIAAVQFYKVLLQNGLVEKTVILKTPFADFDEKQNPIKKHMNKDCQQWAENYEPYYDFLRTIGITILEINDELAVGSNDHKWGPAPYHYIEEAYNSWASNIDNYLKNRSTLAR
ncbi:DUF6270 domain-containing protein [Glutamicibacter arilaitensis]|uniref:DUF6270 domain-containing protein n=1 Tax=Glutamicibacter arilaitensis TaxID=256701 RepID=UPI003FD498D3